MEAVVRRCKTCGGEPESLLAGDLRIDVEQGLLWKREEGIRLSPKEIDLLAFFMKNPNTVFAPEQVLGAVWGADYGAEVDYLRTYVRILTKRIEDDPARPRYILTDAGRGYCFRDPSRI